MLCRAPPLPFYNTYYYCVNIRNHLVTHFPPRLTWALNYWKTTLKSHVYKGFPFINLSTTPIFAYYLTYLVARCKMFLVAEYTHPMFIKGSPPPSTYTTTVKGSPPSPSTYTTTDIHIHCVFIHIYSELINSNHCRCPLWVHTQSLCTLLENNLQGPMFIRGSPYKTTHITTVWPHTTTVYPTENQLSRPHDYQGFPL